MVDIVTEKSDEPGTGRYEGIVEDKHGAVGAGRGQVAITAPLLAAPTTARGVSPSKTFTDLPTPMTFPGIRPSGSYVEGLVGAGGLLQFGEIAGKAMEQSFHVISIDFPVESRKKVRAPGV
jgi:hypothetical protein